MHTQGSTDNRAIDYPASGFMSREFWKGYEYGRRLPVDPGDHLPALGLLFSCSQVEECGDWSDVLLGAAFVMFLSLPDTAREEPTSRA